MGCNKKELVAITKTAFSLVLTSRLKCLQYFVLHTSWQSCVSQLSRWWCGLCQEVNKFTTQLSNTKASRSYLYYNYLPINFNDLLLQMFFFNVEINSGQNIIIGILFLPNFNISLKNQSASTSKLQLLYYWRNSLFVY